MFLTSELLERLVCPRDHKPLQRRAEELVCEHGHSYPIVSGIPIMLLDEVPVTHGICSDTLERSKRPSGPESKGTVGAHGVDSFVQRIIASTNGRLYASLVNNLKDYPIPHIRLAPGNGQLLLDIGCNWGRWCVAAARMGYQPVGIDPSLEALVAAYQVAQQLGVKANFVVADARYLPFPKDTFDVVFSYSVLQHFSKEDAKTSLLESARVLKLHGKCLVQLPQVFGVRNLYNMFRDRNSTNIFRVRYWHLTEIKRIFESTVGSTKLSVDGYFGLGIQPSDIRFLPPAYRIVVRASEFLRKLSLRLPWMINFADSVYAESTKAESSP